MTFYVAIPIIWFVFYVFYKFQTAAYVAVAIISFVFYVFYKFQTAARQKIVAEEAEKERLWQEFSAPWDNRLKLLTSSSGARLLYAEVQAVDVRTEWKERLLLQIKYRWDDFHRHETLAEFRKKSGVFESFPLKAMFLRKRTI